MLVPTIKHLHGKGLNHQTDKMIPLASQTLSVFILELPRGPMNIAASVTEKTKEAQLPDDIREGNWPVSYLGPDSLGPFWVEPHHQHFSGD